MMHTFNMYNRQHPSKEIVKNFLLRTKVFLHIFFFSSTCASSIEKNKISNFCIFQLLSIQCVIIYKSAILYLEVNIQSKRNLTIKTTK